MKKTHEEAEQLLRDLGQRFNSVIRLTLDDKSEVVQAALRQQAKQEEEVIRKLVTSLDGSPKRILGKG